MQDHTFGKGGLESMNLTNLNKEHLAVVILGLAIIISVAYVVGYALILESERNLSNNELIIKLSYCLEEKYERWEGNAPYGYTDTVFARFEHMSEKEVTDLAVKYGIKIGELSTSGEENIIFFRFNLRDNLPTSKVCSFLNDDNIVYHSPYLIGKWA
ncbi:MAG: hypothetical protein JXC85_01695 [Candidatus Aenigmarchaeota archaeon]|nr:hypothetical protein [Candidatus Aenigmarchaeota archaeon]